MTTRLGFVIWGSEPSPLIKEKTKFYEQAAADSRVVRAVGIIFALASGVYIVLYQKSFNLSQRTTLYPVLSGVAGGLLVALGWKSLNQAESKGNASRKLDQLMKEVVKNPVLKGPWKCMVIFISMIERNRGYLTSRLPAIVPLKPSFNPPQEEGAPENRSLEEGVLRKKLDALKIDVELLKDEIEKLNTTPIVDIDLTKDILLQKTQILLSTWEKNIPHYLRYQNNEALSRQVIGTD